MSSKSSKSFFFNEFLCNLCLKSDKGSDGKGGRRIFLGVKIYTLGILEVDKRFF